MTRLHRLAGLVLVVALPLSGARGIQRECERHDAAPMAGMSMPTTGDASSTSSCDMCAAHDALPPCDHPGASGSCMAMVGCAGAPAQPEQQAAGGNVTIGDRVVGTSETPPGQTVSPDTPPPRA